MMKRRGLQCLCVAAPRLSRQRASRALSTESAPAAAAQAQTTTAAEPGRQDPTPESLSSVAATEGLDSTSPPHEESHASKQHRLWSAFKAVISGSLIAGTVASAYVSYAYTSEQIDNKVAALRMSGEVNDLENDNHLQRVQNVLYSTTMKAVAGVAGLYLETRKSIEDQVRGFTAPASDKLLPELLPQERHVFTLVLDLNETLVYSDWTRDRGWRTFKRPGAEAFLEHLAQFYELVVYTDQLPFSVDPILEKLDQKGCIRYRLSREATQYVHGKHYKDLSKLNRDPAHVMFLSAHANETCLQPENAITVKPWKLETDDTMLLDLLPFFEYVARYRPADIRPVLASYSGYDIPSEFLVRTKDYQRKMRELKSQNPFFKSSRSG